MSEEKKLNGTVIVTYRCNARCSMCNRYKAPSKPEEEISIETIKKLPKMYFTNITGGEPFIRTDLKDIVRELYKKSDRIVISTNGFFTDRIVDLCKEFPQIGIRISIEGLEQTNNEIRGLQNGYQRGYGTLKKLREMGMKDVGFGMTVQDKNAPDLVPLYKISNEMGMEFATASLHNSFYFVEAKNIIHDRPMVAKNFENLVNELLRSNSPKKWFRAYFNHGLINYIYGQKRLLPCDMSFDTFFIDPYGDVMPCNGTKDKEVIPYMEMEKEYAGADVFIMPSIRETTGTVLLEAMSKGIPVITINKFGGATLFDKDTGWLYEGNKKEEYIENLKRAILECVINTDEVVRRGKNARKKAEKYTWQEKNKKYQEIYKSLCEAKK